MLRCAVPGARAVLVRAPDVAWHVEAFAAGQRLVHEREKQKGEKEVTDCQHAHLRRVVRKKRTAGAVRGRRDRLV